MYLNQFNWNDDCTVHCSLKMVSGCLRSLYMNFIAISSRTLINLLESFNECSTEIVEIYTGVDQTGRRIQEVWIYEDLINLLRLSNIMTNLDKVDRNYRKLHLYCTTDSNIHEAKIGRVRPFQAFNADSPFELCIAPKNFSKPKVTSCPLLALEILSQIFHYLNATDFADLQGKFQFQFKFQFMFVQTTIVQLHSPFSLYSHSIWYRII